MQGNHQANAGCVHVHGQLTRLARHGTRNETGVVELAVAQDFGVLMQVKVRCEDLSALFFLPFILLYQGLGIAMKCGLTKKQLDSTVSFTQSCRV